MSEPELHAQKIACRGYVFDEFTIDLDRGCLWRAGQEVKLRYKSFETLKYLVERSGRVVSKEEMMQALWPDAFVTDDSLVQCLIEVRRAIGDDAQRYVKTIPRRGYLFDAQVREYVPSASGAASPGAAAQADVASVVIEEQERAACIRAAYERSAEVRRRRCKPNRPGDRGACARCGVGAGGQHPEIGRANPGDGATGSRP